MRLLALETSCDETAVALLDCSETDDDARFRVLGNALYSQVEKHAVYGGVYPSLAKREHAKNLVPLLRQCLQEAGLMEPTSKSLSAEQTVELSTLLSREEELFNDLIQLLSEVAAPPLDAIAVTKGPGLEPALWVGVNFARALSKVWGVPIVPVNHLEGHVIAATGLAEESTERDIVLARVQFPLLAFIASGGHTELVVTDGWGSYKTIGQTRDDSIGEAYDKVARLLGLPYPGGVYLSRIAVEGRRIAHEVDAVGYWAGSFPRAMLRSGDLDFSYSGLKTAVLYEVQKIPELTDRIKKRIAAEFEAAVVEVVLEKVRTAAHEYAPVTFVMGGGVSASEYLRERLSGLFESEFPGTTVLFPPRNLSTDNAVMIGMAGYYALVREQDGVHESADTLRAHSGLKLGRH